MGVLRASPSPSPIWPISYGKRESDSIGMSREEAIGPAEHRVLLVDHSRHPAMAGGDQGGQGRVAAKADDCCGSKLV